MSASVTCAVNEIPDPERRSLENLLGCTLDADQQVCVMAFAPSQFSEEKLRLEAVHRIRNRLAEIDRYQAERRIDAGEVESAIEQAIDHVRMRSK